MAQPTPTRAARVRLAAAAELVVATLSDYQLGASLSPAALDAMADQARTGIDGVRLSHAQRAVVKALRRARWERLGVKIDSRGGTPPNFSIVLTATELEIIERAEAQYGSKAAVVREALRRLAHGE